jgi:MoaA/NifB/PqqE/SkfB family radical SAM enzyme
MTNIDAECTTLPPPKYMYVQLNVTCNLKCQHCHFWRNTNHISDRHADLQLQVVREFASMNPRGTVVTTGGEPLLARYQYFNLCRASRSLGLTSMSATNGTLVADQGQAEELVESGADEVSLSLDHPRAEIHDWLRGARGAWEKTTKCLRMLLAAREKLRLRRKVYAMLMVSDLSYRHLDEAYDLVLNEIGADKLKLRLLLPTFCQNDRGRDTFWKIHSRIDPGVLIEAIDACESKYHLDLNPKWKRSVRLYCESLERYHQGGELGTSEQVCDSPDRNVVVEVGGDVRLCCYPKFPSTPYQKWGDLARYWSAPETEELRVRMRACRDLCGTCHAFCRYPSTREAAARLSRGL